MSNFNNVTGKVSSIFLGNDNQIKREYIIGMPSDTFIIGALFIMAMYHFPLYYKRQKYKATLYFRVFCFLYVLIIIIKDTINNNEGALILLLGFIILLIASVHDMLLQAGLLYTRSIVPFGFFIFIFSQSYILASRFSDAFLKIERLVEDNKAVYIDELTGILNRRVFYE